MGVLGVRRIVTGDNGALLAAFDLDGTLLDSAGQIVERVIACWEACGFPPPDPMLARRIIGLPWKESVLALLPDAGPEEFEKIRRYYDDVREGRRAAPPPTETLFDGARATLEALRGRGYALAIVTSRTGDRLEALLRDHGIDDFFLACKTADMGPSKPDPFLLRQAMDDAGAGPATTVMIGDTTFDIGMAVNAGTHAVGVSWGVHEVDELRAAGAHRIAESFGEVRDAAVAMTGGAAGPARRPE